MDPDSPPLSLSMSELREAVNALVDLIEADLGPTIDLAADYYWHLDGRSAFDMSTTPTIDSGQLSDDLVSLRAAVRSGDMVLWHDLEHLVGILRRLTVLSRP